MPQTPLSLNTVNPAGTLVTNQADLGGALRTTTTPKLTALGVAAASIIKGSPGRVQRINVVVPGSTAGGVYDCLTTQAAATSNQIASIPPLSTAQIGALTVDANAATGIVVIPGTGQTLAVIYE